MSAGAAAGSALGTRLPPVAVVDAQEATGGRAASQVREAWHEFAADDLARRSLWLLLAIIGCCFVGPHLWPWEALEIDRAAAGATAPSLTHPLGTDTLGRDQVARLLQAGQVSLTIGFVVAFFSAAFGSLVGITAGYLGGRIDALLMLLVDVLLTVPPLPLLVAVAGILASSESQFGQALEGVPEMWRIIIVMSALGWMTIARVVRSEVLRIRQEPYIEAARALGAEHARVMWAHVLPNAVRPMIVFCTMAVSAAIMGESGLSFLGMGVSPPEPTWGNMIAEVGTVFMFTHNWWLVWTPAAAVLATILCFNFVSEGLERALVAD